MVHYSISRAFLFDFSCISVNIIWSEFYSLVGYGYVGKGGGIPRWLTFAGLCVSVCVCVCLCLLGVTFQTWWMTDCSNYPAHRHTHTQTRTILSLSLLITLSVHSTTRCRTASTSRCTNRWVYLPVSLTNSNSCH